MKIFAEDIPVIQNWRSQGESWKKIADKCHCTETAVRIAVQKENRKPKHFQTLDARRFAQQQLRHAVRRGEIVKSTRCESCDKIKKRIIGHHKDYSKPLAVNWLCVRCHAKEHPESRKIRYVEYKPLLAEKKSQDFLNRYGKLSHKLLMQYKSDPQITMNDIAEVAGVTREYIRQLVVIVYGNTNKQVIKKKCFAVRNIGKTETNHIYWLSKYGIEVKRISPNRYKDDNDKIYTYRTPCYHALSRKYNYRLGVYGYRPIENVDIVCCKVNDNLYVVPYDNCPRGYFNIEEISLYLKGSI